MSVFFTSDLHFSHKNIIQYCNRPFGSVEEMNEGLVERWNAVVRPGDLVYILGDFYLGSDSQAAVEFAGRLVGQKYLIWGNHDKRLRGCGSFINQFQWCKDLQQIEVQDQKITLCHFAMVHWNQSHRGAWQLHGHSHGTLPDDPNSLRLDVGVDCWDWAPVSFERLQDRMAQKTWKSVDHHNL